MLKPIGIKHGGPKRGTNCTINVVQGGWHDDTVKCRNTCKTKVQHFKVNGKFLFIVLFIIVTAIHLSKQRGNNNNKQSRTGTKLRYGKITGRPLYSKELA